MAILKVWVDTQGRAACRSCHAPITWFAFVDSGKKHPFDGEPTFVRTERDDASGRQIGHIDSTIDRSHFATCPDAGRWRK